MNCMRLVFTIYLFFSSPFLSLTQVNGTHWGISDTNLNISKTTDFGTVHDYLELFNYSGQDLEMRWVAHFNLNWPSLWVVSFTDPAVWHPIISDLDSADFMITDPIGWQNKLIIGVAHQSQAGTGTVNFKVFPVDYPEDTLWLHYTTFIDQGNAYAAIDDYSNSRGISIQMSGEKYVSIVNKLNVESTIKVYDLLGKIVYSSELEMYADQAIDLNFLQSGMYVVSVNNSKGIALAKKKIVL